MVGFIDLKGRTFGKLTVLGLVENQSSRTRWKCRCSCAKEIEVVGSNLRSGNTSSCGCLRVERASKVKPGMKFGRLTVLARDGSKRYGKVAMSNWHCSCDCGQFKSALGMSLMSGDTQSCGCLHRESAAENGKAGFEDLTSQEFGNLVVIERASIDKVGNIRWLCACGCGNLTILRAHSIKSGTTVSCGCKQFTGKTFRNDSITLKARVHGARRRAAELTALCPFDRELFDLVEMEAHALAQVRTSITGDEWAVDHIIPLQSPIVCGLHSEYNFAVITKTENSKKRNFYWPDMP